jgi:GTP:adenosylcobinamide-phosphate guanylyltransferase
MAGGKGERFGGPHKPLAKLCNKTMIEWVVEKALKVSKHVFIAVSNRTLNICRLFQGNPLVVCIGTSGEGYVTDLSLLLSMLPKPLLVLPSDTPLIPVDILLDFINKGIRSSSDIVELVIRKNDTDELVGISLFHSESGSEEKIIYPYSIQLVDIDTYEELKNAEEYCKDSWGKASKRGNRF